MSQKSSPSTTPRSGRLVRGFRAGLIVLTIVAGCYVAYGYCRLWAEWQRTSRSPGFTAAAAADSNLLAPVLPLSGPWSFANLDWSIRTSTIARNEVDVRFASLAELPPGEQDGQLPDMNADLVQLVEEFHIKPVEHAGNQIYRLDRPNLEARLIVRNVSGRPKVVALAAAVPHQENQWQLFELTPRGASANAAADSHLLPLPALARREGGRFADDGAALMELISLDTTAEQLLATWETAGWEVRPSGLGRPQEFSYLCARGNEVIYTWSADEHSSIKNLMLVRTPNDPDTDATPLPRVPPATPQ